MRAPRSCAICDGEVLPVFVAAGHEIFECSRCDHRMTWPNHPGADPAAHVREVYSDDYFLAGGAGYPNYLEEESLMVRRGRWYAALMRRHGLQLGRVLDVGAAAGFVLKGLEDCGWQGVGVEPNARMARHARDVLQRDVRTGTLETLELPASSPADFDLICFFQVLAHFIDPRLALERAETMLAPNGHVLIETWDWKSLTARFFGESWHEYSPPSVLHWFCPASLERLGREFGLEQVASGRPLKKLTGKHARSLVAFKSGEGAVARLLAGASSLIPLDAELPYPFDDVRWTLFARSARGQDPGRGTAR